MAKKKKRKAAGKPEQRLVCTQCQSLLAFSRGIVTVNNKSLRRVPVAFCATCRRYYTYELSLRNQKITIDNYPVRWVGQDQPTIRKKPLSRYRAYEQERINSLHREKKRLENQKQSTNEMRVKEEVGSEFVEDLILLQIPLSQNTMRSCPFCNTSFKKMFPIRYRAFQENEQIVMHAYARVCAGCQAVMMDDGQINEVRRQANGKRVFTIEAKNYRNPRDMMKAAQEMPNHQIMYKGKLAPLPFEKDLNKTENLSTANKVVSIYAHKCHCHGCSKKYQQNTIRNRTAMVQTVYGRTIGVNVMFCAGCGQYYMNLKAFEEYRKIHKGLLFECVFSSDVSSKDSVWLGFAPDSVLSRCGYNAKADTDEEYRRAILRYLLDSGKASKYEIIEKLSEFIEIRTNRANMAAAIEKWKSDIHFVSQYQIAEQHKIYNVEFKQGGKVHR